MPNTDIKKAIEILTASLNDDVDGVYPSEYVVNRFLTAQKNNPTDVLIGNMKDVVVKIASKQQMITRDELSRVYSQMHGLNTNSSIKTELGDLFNKVEQKISTASFSNRRTNEEVVIHPKNEKTELSNALSVIFSLNKGETKNSIAKKVEIKNSVKLKLASMGMEPTDVDVVNQNEHFALAIASYDTSSFKKASLKIPVQVSDSKVYEPEYIIDGNDTVQMNKKNVLVALKASELNSSSFAKKKFASERDLENKLKIDPMVVPASLSTVSSDLESTLVAAASKFDHTQIKLASSIVNSELLDLGVKVASVKINSSNDRTIVFDAVIGSVGGPAKIQVPVEFVNGKPLLPSKFASEVNKTQKVYDLNQLGISTFLSYATQDRNVSKMARVDQDYSNMSYAQLMDSIVTNVANENLLAAEDALSSIQARFDSDKFKVALENYANILKHSSTQNNEREQLVKSAIARGELIKVPTSVEYYNPRLGLPLSKIAFDSEGRMIPLHAQKRKASEGVEIKTSSIILN